MITGFRSILLKFVAFAVVAILLFVLLLNTMINSVPSGTRSFTAYFTSVSGLGKGSDVRAAGVRVGKVTGIKSVENPGLAESGIPMTQQRIAAVTFDVQKSQALLATTQIKMKYQNLLGQRFLSLEQDTSQEGWDSAPALADNAHIAATEIKDGQQVLVDGAPVAITDPGFDLTELLAGFKPLLETLQPSEVNALASSIIQVLQGEGGSIENLLQQTTQVTNYLADRDQVIGQVLTNLTPVLKDFAGQGAQLKTTVSSLRQLMDGLAKDRTSIGASVSHLSTLITSTSTLIEDARKPLTIDAHLFRQVVETTNAQKELLTKALSAFGEAFGALGRVSSYVNGVNIYACSITLDIAGVQVNLNGNNPLNAKGGPWTGACKK